MPARRLTPEQIADIRAALKTGRKKVSYVFIGRDLLAELDAVTAERNQYRDRFEHIAQNPGYWIEVEEGTACVAYYRHVTVCNGQKSVEQCFDVARAAIWGDGGTMRPEFAAKLKRASDSAASNEGGKPEDYSGMTLEQARAANGGRAPWDCPECGVGSPHHLVGCSKATNA